jgi:hypothetical protein
MQARILLASQDLKKSGENKFAGYKYFELGDFLPQTMQIFYDLDLASVVTFAADTASLTIIDCEDKSTVVITSPMADANLKGAHPIQNLGAVESYQRRYLWLAAMEIVESDVLDASEPSTPRPKAEPKVEAKPAVKPAQKIVGDDGDWQIVISGSPGSPDWFEMVDRVCTDVLAMAESVDDVMSIFRRNKQLFDTVKAGDANFFKDLMAKFTKAKARFTE